MTHAELKRELAYWKRVLRLQDWKIRLEVVRFHELGEGRGGEVSYIVQQKAATIRLKDTGDFDNDFDLDIRFCLIHELLHLHLAAWETEPDTYENDLKEQALNMITNLLMSLRKG